ncbi:hypothetical protein HAX54_048842 [Datura stramonium]|uniref:Uncharacterized protein n=1 Tax=Datura stramonium TaxID=4076 RepID=A0ABS8WNN5_DATST|nr:hypothetical protein [Datura stramonium]
MAGLKKRLESAKGNRVEEFPRVLSTHHITYKFGIRETPFSLIYGSKSLISIEVKEPSLRFGHTNKVKNSESIYVQLDLLKEHRELMAKKYVSTSASRSKELVGWGAGHGTTPSGSRAGAHKTRVQTKAQANPQPEILNGSQPRVAAPKRVQEQVVQDAPSIVPAIVPIVVVPTNIVMIVLNMLESLVPSHVELPVSQTTSHT